MKLSLLSRRHAIISLASVASLSRAEGNTKTANLIPLNKANNNELLLKISLTKDHIFALWREGLVRGPARLACYSLDGQQIWSENLGSVPVFDFISTGDNEIQVATISLAPTQVTFAKYDPSGSRNIHDLLSFEKEIVGVAADSKYIAVLDIENNLSVKAFAGGSIASKVSNVFSTPSIGGHVPRGNPVSMHFLGNRLIILDQAKARTAIVDPQSLQITAGQLDHPAIAKKLETQDQDVQSRMAIGKGKLPTFPSAFIFAASDHDNSIWIVPQPLNARNISLFKVDSSLAVTESSTVRVPDDPMLKGKPPLMLSACHSALAFGFREGVIAITKETTA